MPSPGDPCAGSRPERMGRVNEHRRHSDAAGAGVRSGDRRGAGRRGQLALDLSSSTCPSERSPSARAQASCPPRRPSGWSVSTFADWYCCRGARAVVYGLAEIGRDGRISGLTNARPHGRRLRARRVFVPHREARLRALLVQPCSAVALRDPRRDRRCSHVRNPPSAEIAPTLRQLGTVALRTACLIPGLGARCNARRRRATADHPGARASTSRGDRPAADARLTTGRPATVVAPCTAGRAHRRSAGCEHVLCDGTWLRRRHRASGTQADEAIT